ncbi:MAG: cell division protein FtsQ/DivIB [Proteobacteria bacterium]|nr:cell division protein FtsQ/DivIB [Pseudomonadota bacterium]
MWDNAPLLRSISGALFFCSVVAMLYGAGHYVVHMPKLLPIKTVRLDVAPGRVVAADVLAMVRQRVQGNFLTVDIDSLRRSLEKLPWVRNVSIRREFPNRLVVQFEEHKALARWNESLLVNQQGEVFVAETTQDLPGFTGYEGTSAEVTQQYEKFSRQLKVLNLQINRLALSPRHAWQLHLSNDMVVELGREAMGQRLARFVAVYPYSLVPGDASAREVQVVDMRYRDGFAVKKRSA